MSQYKFAIYKVAKVKESEMQCDISYIAVIPETSYVKNEWLSSQTLFGLWKKLRTAGITGDFWEEAEVEIAANGFYEVYP